MWPCFLSRLHSEAHSCKFKILRDGGLTSLGLEKVPSLRRDNSLHGSDQIDETRPTALRLDLPNGSWIDDSRKEVAWRLERAFKFTSCWATKPHVFCASPKKDFDFDFGVHLTATFRGEHWTSKDRALQHDKYQTAKRDGNWSWRPLHSIRQFGTAKPTYDGWCSRLQFGMGFGRARR